MDAMEPTNTIEAKMAQQKQAGFGVVCGPVLCCFWIPMIFFMGAANIKAECEKSEDLKMWLQIYGIGPLALSVVIQCLAMAAARQDNVTLFKLSGYLQGSMMVISITLMVWGWIIFGATTNGNCNGPDGVKPRTLALVWLIFASIGFPLGLLLLCCVLCQLVVAVKAGGGGGGGAGGFGETIGHHENV